MQLTHPGEVSVNDAFRVDCAVSEEIWRDLTESLTINDSVGDLAELVCRISDARVYQC